MLSDLERERLKNRESENPKIRAINDMRIKKKLASWLEDCPDVMNIIQHIPEDKLKDDISDIDVYRLMNISMTLLKLRRFMNVEGSLEKPDEWKAVGYGTTRPIEEIDIGRVYVLQPIINDFQAYIGQGNPVLSAFEWERLKKHWEGLKDDPSFIKMKPYELITPEMEKGIELVNETGTSYINKLVKEITEEPK